MKIEPCPKCKEVDIALLRCGDWKRYHVIYCRNCGYTPAKTCEASLTLRGALRLWNRRTREEGGA